MIKEEINDFVVSLCEYISKKNGVEYEIYATYGDSFDVKVVGGQIDNYSVNDFIGISLRIKTGGKTGYSSTTSPNKSDIPYLVERAIDNAAVIESPDEQFIYSGDEAYPSPVTYKESLSNVSAAEKIALAQKMEKAALDYDESIVRTMGSYVCSQNSCKIIKNSNGLDVSENYGFIAAYVIPIAEKNKSMNSGFAHTAGFGIEDLDIEKTAKEASADAIKYCGISSCDGGLMKTAIDAVAAVDLLETFMGIFSSENTQRGLSLLAGKEGVKIASDCVNITDDPTEDFSFGARGFDDEGVASRKCTVVEKGILKTLLYNLKTAKKAGVGSTASACKSSYSSPVSVGFSNFRLQAGNFSKDEILQSLNNGILITSLEGLHAGADASTGDFSLSAKGVLIKDGKEDRAVTGLTISGNIYALLLNVEALGDDVFTNPFGSIVSSPTILLGDPMAIAAGGNDDD